MDFEQDIYSLAYISKNDHENVYSQNEESDSTEDFTEYQEHPTENNEYLLQYDHIGNYTLFEEIPIMTITMIGYFDGKLSDYDDINEDGEPICGSTLWKLNHLLPVMRTNSKKPTRIVKKITLRYPGMPWIIMTTNLNGEIRGIVKTTKEGTWPNSIMIDMSVPDKMINFKLSPTNIHMCGCKSTEMGKIASYGLLNYVNFINNSLILILQYPEDARRIADEILYECIVPGEFEFDDRDGSLYSIFDPSLVLKHEQDTLVQSKIRIFLSMEVGDLVRVNQAASKLEWVLSLTPLFNREFDIDSWYVCLTKYRFKLGFKIDLARLVGIIYDEFDYFYTDYHPHVQDYVKVEIFDPHAGISCKEKAKHTFNIQTTGEVTYNSPNIENSRAIYNLFINTIDEIRSDIEIQT